MPSRFLLHADQLSFTAVSIPSYLPILKFAFNSQSKEAELYTLAGKGHGKTRVIGLESLLQTCLEVCKTSLALDCRESPSDLTAGVSSILPPICCIPFGGSEGWSHTTPDNGLCWVYKQLSAALRGSNLRVPVDLYSLEEPMTQVLVAACLKNLTSSGLTDPVPDASIYEPDSEMPHDARTSFHGAILRWSTQMVLHDTRLLQKRVEKLPESFPPGAEGILQWGRMQFWLTLEEVRSHIKAPLENLQEGSYVQVLVDSREDLDADKEVQNGVNNIVVSNTAQSRVLLASNQQEGWTTSGPGGGRRSAPPLGCKPTDLVLISSEPADACYLDHRPHLLGLVKRLKEDDDNSFALVVTVHAAKGSPLARMLGLEEEQTSDGAHKRQQVWYMAPLGNMATPIRIWDALQKAMHVAGQWQERAELEGSGLSGFLSAEQTPTPMGLSRALLKVLPEMPHEFDWPSPVALRRDNPHIAPLLSAATEYCIARGLNESQVHSIEHAAAASFGRGGSACSVQLIQGPPGTGKTSTIVALLLVLSGSGRSVLLCAPTNVAIREVASRFMAEIQDQHLGEREAAPESPASSRRLHGQFAGSRFWPQADSGSNSAAGAQSSRITLGDVVLLASEDSIPEGNPLNQLWSQARARRLADLIRGQGLRARGRELVMLLGNAKDGFARYQAAISAEGDDEDGDTPENSIAEAIPALQQQKQQQQPLQSQSGLLAWFLKSFKLVHEDLARLGTIIQHDLPTSLLLPGALGRLDSLLRSLHQFQQLCTQALPTDVEVRRFVPTLAAWNADATAVEKGLAF